MMLFCSILVDAILIYPQKPHANLQRDCDHVLDQLRELTGKLSEYDWLGLESQ